MNRQNAFFLQVPTALVALAISCAAQAGSYQFYHLGIAGTYNGVHQPVVISTVPQSGSIGTVLGFDEQTGHPFGWVGGTLMGRFFASPALEPTAISQDGAYASLAGTPASPCSAGYGLVPSNSFFIGGNCMPVFGVNNNHVFVGQGPHTVNGVTQTRPYSISCSTSGCGAAILYGTLGGNFGSARAINNLNLIVGASTTSFNITRAMFVAVGGGVPRDFDPSHADYSSIANAVNDSGVAVGAVTPGNCPPSNLGVLCSHGQYAHSLPVLYPRAGAVVSLGSLGGLDGAALSINRGGWIVGWSTTSSGARRGFISTGSGMTDLNTSYLVNGFGWTITEADGINDNGQIVGRATGPQGQDEVVVLVPIGS